MDKNLKSQNALVLRHLIRFGWINKIVAEQRYGVGRLAARIGNLRDKHGASAIKTVTVKGTNSKTGRPCRYAKYVAADRMRKEEPRR